MVVSELAHLYCLTTNYKCEIFKVPASLTWPMVKPSLVSLASQPSLAKICDPDINTNHRAGLDQGPARARDRARAPSPMICLDVWLEILARLG